MSDKAKLTMRLAAPSGYKSKMDGEVTPEQWGDLTAIVSGHHTKAESTLCAAVILAQHRLTSLRDQFDGLRGQVIDRELKTFAAALAIADRKELPNPEVLRLRELNQQLIDAARGIINEPMSADARRELLIAIGLSEI